MYADLTKERMGTDLNDKRLPSLEDQAPLPPPLHVEPIFTGWSVGATAPRAILRGGLVATAQVQFVDVILARGASSWTHPGRHPSVQGSEGGVELIELRRAPHVRQLVDLRLVTVQAPSQLGLAYAFFPHRPIEQPSRHSTLSA